MRSATLAAIALAALTLGACDTVSAVKATLYSTGAKAGNRYCETRDPALRDDLIARINAGLHGEGARFALLGVSCDEESDGAPQG